MDKPTTSYYWLLLVTSALLAVWPVPGTIGLRNVLLGLLLVLLILAQWNNRTRWQFSSGVRWPRWPLGLFLALTFWIVLVIVGWSAEPALSWHEFWGQWTLPALCGMMGALVATQAQRFGGVGHSDLMGTVFYTFFGLVFLHDVLDAIYWAATGQMPFRQAPVLYLPQLPALLLNDQSIWSAFDGRFGEKFSFVNNTFAALLFAEIIQRLMQKTRCIPVSNLVLGIGFVALLLCSYWLSFRNGNIGLLSMLTMAGVMVLVRLRNRVSFIKIMAVLILGSGLLVFAVSAFWKSDPRWARFSETLPVAWDTEHHQAWISTRLEPYPLLSDGNPVDASAYERIAWIKEGSKLALEHPLGTGLNRNAFFDGIDRKFNLGGTVRGGHAHSGIVDFTIANGLPGIALWIAFLASVAWIGWKAFRDGQVSVGLILMFLVSGFFSRSIVDSNIRDHVLQQFVFMIGLFTIMANNTPSSNELT